MHSLRSRQGGSHVGFILSFVIFITFLVFLYTYIQPQQARSAEKEFTLQKVKNLVIANVSGEVTETLLTFNPALSGETCVEFDSPIGGKIYFNLVESGGTEGDYEVKKETIFLNLKDSDSDGIYSYRMSYAQQFPKENIGSVSGCTQIYESSGDFQKSSVRKQSFVFEWFIVGDHTSTNPLKRSTGILEHYEHTGDQVTYAKLKEQFGVPSSSDFYLRFENADGEVFAPAFYASELPEIPQGVDVYSEREALLYMDANGDKRTGYLTVTVW